jgi:hypothetical protein
MSPVEKTSVKRKTSESRRYTRLVRLDDEVVDQALEIASWRGSSAAELLSELLRPILSRLHEAGPMGGFVGLGYEASQVAFGPGHPSPDQR